jgi:hypothetical protein
VSYLLLQLFSTAKLVYVFHICKGKLKIVANTNTIDAKSDKFFIATCEDQHKKQFKTLTGLGALLGLKPK